MIGYSFDQSVPVQSFPGDGTKREKELFKSAQITVLDFHIHRFCILDAESVYMKIPYVNMFE